MKRTILFLLALSLLILPLASCGGGNGEEATTEWQSQELNESAAYFLDTVEDKWDYETIYMTAIESNTHGGDELTAESSLVDEGRFKQHLITEEHFDVDLEWITLTNSDNDIAEIRTQCNLEDGAYAHICTALRLMTLATEGLMKNLNSIATLNLQNEWWNQSMNENMDLGGAMYVTAGPIAEWYYGAPFALAFNKTLMTNYNIPDIYSTVQAGNWTLEELQKITTDYGLYQPNDQGTGQYALTVNTGNTGYSWLVSCGVKMTEVSEDGEISVSHLGNEATRNAIEKVQAAMRMDEVYYNTIEPSFTVFKENRALFWGATTGYMSSHLPSSEIDYGIIPCPKLDSSQEEYVSAGWANSNFALAVTGRLQGDELEWVGAFLDVYCFLGYEYVKPAKYDAIMKYQVANDPVASEMMDIIFGNMIFDLNMCVDFGGTAALMDKVCEGTLSLGMLSSMIKMSQGAVDKDLQAYKALLNLQ